MAWIGPGISPEDQYKERCVKLEEQLRELTIASSKLVSGTGDLERNAKYRAEAVQPIVDELKIITYECAHIGTLLDTTNDLLAELIKRSH